MKLEGVICCVDYSDFLAATLPTNRSLFDRLVVVTAPEDEDTQQVCEYWHVECVLTDRFRSRWGEFCKGCGISVGLSALRLDGWALHLDADIMLPPLTRRLIEQADLDKSMLYGVDRHLIQDVDAWREHMAMPKLQQENNSYVHMDPFRVGARFSTSAYGGYMPIGFFQLWHPKVSGVRRYPEAHATAARTDTLFAQQWPRAKRALLPELVAYHLESEPAPQGTNWDGRQTRAFGPAAHHRARRHHGKHHHHHHHHHRPYEDGEGA